MKLVRGFSRIEPRKLAVGLLVGCFMVSLIYFFTDRSYAVLRPVSLFAPRIHSNSSSRTSESPSGSDSVADTKISQDHKIGTGEAAAEHEHRKPMMICNVSDPRADYCETRGDIRIHGSSSSVLVLGGDPAGRNESWRVRPYARKQDDWCMTFVRQVLVKTVDNYSEAPHCAITHSVPAIVFSVHGYTDNFFHSFNDVLVPLFLTSYQFNGEVQFLVTDWQPWWIQKFFMILRKLSRYKIIDFDKDDRVHCFPQVIVGLLCHKEFSIDPSRAPNGYSMVDFTRFMRSTYSLRREVPLKLSKNSEKRPKLLIVSRNNTRKLTNVNAVIRMSEELGFEVVATEADTNVAQFARVVNSFDVMMGVHGAGLTHIAFLPTTAVFIQIIPCGNLEWLAWNYFREPAMDMKLKYLEYRISDEESTLSDEYPKDHPVFKDPSSIQKQGWGPMGDIYLLKQNVRLDLHRFRPVLLKAIELLQE